VIDVPDGGISIDNNLFWYLSIYSSLACGQSPLSWFCDEEVKIRTTSVSLAVCYECLSNMPEVFVGGFLN
jgi:hypothetical protein